MKRTSKPKSVRKSEPGKISDAEFKRVRAITMRKYGRTLKLLAAYDRGEWVPRSK